MLDGIDVLLQVFGYRPPACFPVGLSVIETVIEAYHAVRLVDVKHIARFDTRRVAKRIGDLPDVVHAIGSLHLQAKDRPGGAFRSESRMAGLRRLIRVV